MTLRRLVWRSLTHYRHTSLLVILGLLVATAVITGSLAIGDSLRGSLRDTALGRLGNVDQALIAPRMLPEHGLIAALRRSARRVVAVQQFTGSVESATSEATAPEATLWVVPDEF